MIRKSLCVSSAVFLVFQLANVSAQESSEKEIPPKVPETSLSVTSHAIQLNGEPLKYTATAGYLLINEDTEKPKANIFFTAYTKDGAEDESRRPITFAFNGGPGTSSVWLHLGALGPRKALMNDEGFPLPGPYRLVDNEYSILDVTDLVMVDPVSTGYSRPAQGADPKSFHGYTEDIESLGEFIRLYIARHERWASPKFILGESYGTTRSAGLSEFLQRDRYGMFLKGLILVSCGLNFQTIVFGPGNDLPTILFLPTYTATAWYHKKLPSDLQARNLPDVLDEVERFALEEYTVALMKGNELPADEKREMIQKLERYSGLSPKYIEQTNMRIDNRRFLKEFLRDEHQTVSRLDSRFKGRDADSAGEFHEFDSASGAMYGPFSSS